MIKKKLGFAINLLALFLFVPGIVLPMFSLSMEMTANVSGSNLSSTLIDKELSLVNTIQELFLDDRILVGLLILIFSICIPVLKTIMVSVAFLKREQIIEKKIINFVASIGKWSMADVFVIAIFLAVLSTNHAETTNAQQLALFGFKLNLNISSETLSFVGQGFYYFTAYCLLSLIGTHLYQSALKEKN
ncbi:paraquat-inducible protein A [Pseudocolwellia sp. HL-MZ19]|uniref:paraquat-inducible protein A n=1 Tax=unclassified Pseudocolwellia TaxID=2848178 RepID=UPI003CEE73ED